MAHGTEHPDSAALLPCPRRCRVVVISSVTGVFGGQPWGSRLHLQPSRCTSDPSLAETSSAPRPSFPSPYYLSCLEALASLEEDARRGSPQGEWECGGDVTPPGTLLAAGEDGVSRASLLLPVPTAWPGTRMLSSPSVPGPMRSHLPACQMAERVGCQHAGCQRGAGQRRQRREGDPRHAPRLRPAQQQLPASPKDAWARAAGIPAQPAARTPSRAHLCCLHCLHCERADI